MLLPFYQNKVSEAGCDEAGRGCLAGPVFAAAVILPKDFQHPFLNDSKQLTVEQRNELRPLIEEQAIAWSEAMEEHTKIDEIKIFNASFLAIHRPLNGLKRK